MPFYLSIIAEMTQFVISFKKMKLEYRNVIVEIVDLDTGEVLLQSRKKVPFYSYGLQGLDWFYKKFHDILRTGRNITINVSAFDPRLCIDYAEDFFMSNKHIPGIF